MNFLNRIFFKLKIFGQGLPVVLAFLELAK
jgi:hypothetical protein